MLPTTLLALALSSTPLDPGPVEVPFTDPVMIQLEDSAKKQLARSKAIVAEQLKIRADILAQIGGRPPNQVQQAGLDQTAELIREFTEAAVEYQQTLDAMARLKRGVPFSEAGFPRQKAMPPKEK